MFQKHSYKNTVAYPGLCRTSRGYQGQSLVIFFQTHSLHLGKKGCVCISSLFPGCQICVHVCISDFWMPSLCASAFQEWAKDWKCLGILSQYVFTSVHGLSSVSVFTYTFISIEERIPSIYLPHSATEQPCRASPELRFAVSRAASPEAWAGHLGEGCTSTSEHPASHLNICVQSCLTK